MKKKRNWYTGLQHLHRVGYAPRYRTLRELAEIIRIRRVIRVNDEDIQLGQYEPFGKDWQRLGFPFYVTSSSS